jgi:hypothetical protein
MKPEDRPVVLALLAVAASGLVLTITEATCGHTGSNCPNFVKDYQSGIVGMLGLIAGFAGVILTLRHNAKLAREQSDRNDKLTRQQALDQLDLERRSLRAQLVADLTRAKDAYTWHLQNLSTPIPVNNPCFVQGRHWPTLYDGVMDKLVLLTPAEVSKLTDAYGYAKQATQIMRFQKAAKGISDPLDSEDIIIVTEACRLDIKGVYEQYLAWIEDAIVALNEADKSASLAPCNP